MTFESYSMFYYQSVTLYIADRSKQIQAELEASPRGCRDHQVDAHHQTSQSGERSKQTGRGSIYS